MTSAARSNLLPAVPTLAAITQQIARELAEIVASTEVRERLARLGAEPMAMTPAEFSQFVQREIENAERIARISGIRAQ